MSSGRGLFRRLASVLLLGWALGFLWFAVTLNSIGDAVIATDADAEHIRGGAQAAHIIDGRRPHSLLLELFTDVGIGTMVKP